MADKKYSDMLGLSEKDFDGKELIKKYSNDMSVQEKSPGEIKKEVEIAKGKVTVIGY